MVPGRPYKYLTSAPLPSHTLLCGDTSPTDMLQLGLVFDGYHDVRCMHDTGEQSPWQGRSRHCVQVCSLQLAPGVFLTVSFRASMHHQSGTRLGLAVCARNGVISSRHAVILRHVLALTELHQQVKSSMISKGSS